MNARVKVRLEEYWKMAQNENLKFFLVNQMQSFASIVLNTLLDKRFHNESATYPEQSGVLSVTPLCRKELIQVSSSALRNEPWALKVFDSNGRFRTGLLSGSLFNLIGNYEQCLDVSKISKQKQNLIQGTSYCSAQIEFSKEAHQLSLITDQQEAYKKLGRVARLGLCVPGSCQIDDISSLANHIFSTSLSSALGVQQVECYKENQFTLWESSPSFVFSIVLIVILFSAITSATILDYHHFRRKARSSLKIVIWLISTFSLINGWKRLTKTRKSLPSKKQFISYLSILDGLRVLSMFWIIAIHSYNFGIQWLQIDNVCEADNVYKTIWIQWIANGTFSVDNFFLISGLLVTNKYLSRKLAGHSEVKRKLSDSREMNISHETTTGFIQRQRNIHFNMELSRALFACLKRYFRLAPVMMILILFSVGLLPQFAYGPNWHQATTMFDDWCRTGWHLNLFMMQNFISTPTMCFSHSWFIAADWQLFVLIQLIFLTTYWLTSSISSNSRQEPMHIRLSKVIFNLLSILKWLLICLIIIAQMIVAATIYHNGLVSIPLIPSHSMEAMINYYSLIYIKPHYWLASYFIGSLTAICLHSIFIIKIKPKQERDSTKIVFKRWLPSILIQFVSLALMVALILSAMPYFTASSHRMSGLEAALYGFFSRPIWSLCIASTLILAALRSNSNRLNITTPTDQKSNLVTSFIRFILSANLWLPLSRLTYSAYLLHPVLMAAFYGSRTETFQFSHWLLLYFVIGNIVLTYIAALVIYLFIEIPIQVTIKRIEQHYIVFIDKN